MFSTKTQLLILSIMLCLGQLRAQYTTVQSIPNPKHRGNFFVSNPLNIINAEEERELEQKLQQIERESTIEIALVIINSVGSNNPKSFATDLFNYWGVGKASKDNGLLILVLIEERRIEFITGYGINQVLTDQKCVDIQQNYIISHFKQEDYARGLNRGISEVYRVLNASRDADGVYRVQPKPTSRIEQILLLVISIWLLISLSTIFSNFLIKKEPYEKYKRLDFVANDFWVILPILFIVGSGIGLWFSGYPLNHQIYGTISLASVLICIYSIVTLRSYYRYAKRNCPKTGKPMAILDESEEDEYLAKGQVTEERIKSKQYDVWATHDKTEVLVLQYKGTARKYSTCSKCSYTTNYLRNSVVTSRATYTSTGSKRQDYECKHCHHQYSKTITLPMLVESSSSSSSSSGGSWGGGSSGGSGGGSSW